MTVRELLLHPLLAGSRAVGSSGLDFEPSWLVEALEPSAIGAAEVEDIALAPLAAWNRPGAAERLERLAALGVGCFMASVPLEAGSGGEAGRPELDPVVAARCEELGIPFVVLNPGLGYRELSWLLASAEASAAQAEASDGVAATLAEPRADEPSKTLAGLEGALGDRILELGIPAAIDGLENRDELVSAVGAYIRHGRNAVAAAAELGVHRHTVHARVARYEALTGLSLEDADLGPLLALAFSLEARRRKR